MSDIWEWIGNLPEGVRVVFGAVATVLTLLFGSSRLQAKYANSESDRLEAQGEVDLRTRIASMDGSIRDLSVRVTVTEADIAGLAAAFSSVLLCDQCRKSNHALLDMMHRIFERHKKIGITEKEH